MGTDWPVVVPIDQHDWQSANSHMDELGRPLLAAQVEDFVTLDRQPAEDGDPLPLAAPPRLGADVDRVAAKLVRKPVGGAGAKWVGHLLESDQVERPGSQAMGHQVSTLGPAGLVPADVDGCNTKNRSHGQGGVSGIANTEGKCLAPQVRTFQLDPGTAADGVSLHPVRLTQVAPTAHP